MSTFIEDYLNNPNSALAAALERSKSLSWASEIDEEMVYDDLASGQFRLYDAMVFSSDADDLNLQTPVRPVA